MRLTARGRYLDEQSGLTRDAILVLPGHERRSMGLISVLDELGTALLGLRAGQSMHWRSGRRGHRSIRLLEVVQ